jgi:hypothetical protein
MRERRPRRRAAAILGAAALLLAAGPRRSAEAHDATDAPPRGPEDAGHGGAVAGAASGSAGAAPSPLVWPLVVAGAGAVMVGAGGWWLHDEAGAKAGSCVGAPSSRESCGSPSVGPGLGLALVLVGAQVTVGGLVWLGVRWHGRRAPVALELGPRTLALSATF